MKKATMILNPVAGRKKESLVDRVITQLRENFSLTIVKTTMKTSGTALAEAALAEQTDLVIAAGGDGTIAEVINGLATSDTPLAIIPLGTANVLALELGIATDPLQAAADLREAQPRTIALGNINGHYFSLMAGVGLDARAVQYIEENLALKRSWGRLGYLWMAFKSLSSYEYPLINLEINGIEQLARSVIISNSHYYGGKINLFPQTSVRQSGLVVLLQRKKQSTFQLLKALLKILGNQPLSAGAGFEYFPGTEITLDAAIPVPIQVDGDFWGFTPARITSVPNALTVYYKPTRSG